jgi:hypothetical protein
VPTKMSLAERLAALYLDHGNLSPR